MTTHFRGEHLLENAAGFLAGAQLLQHRRSDLIPGAVGAVEDDAQPVEGEIHGEGLLEEDHVAAGGVVDALRETVRLQERSALLQGERAQLNDAEIKWADLIRKSETDSVKQAREINAIRTQGLAARKSEAEIERAIADYREKNAKKGGADNSAARDAEAQRRAIAEALGVLNTP